MRIEKVQVYCRGVELFQLLGRTYAIQLFVPRTLVSITDEVLVHLRNPAALTASAVVYHRRFLETLVSSLVTMA